MPRFRTLLFGLITSGLALWAVNYFYARPLFMDEANVARNVFDRSFLELFAPLDHRQYAPPLYLVLTKLMGELFGYGELSLRLPAMLGGLLTIGGLVYGGQRMGLGYWTLLPLGFLFVNPTALRYVGELKPYGLDLGIAAVLHALYLRDDRRAGPREWAIIGAIVPWFSLPSVFVLAGMGLTGLVREGWRWIPIGTVWLASFSLLYLMVLRPAVGTDYLNNYHGDYFFPLLPTTLTEVGRAGQLLLAQLKMTFGYTAVAQLTGAGLILAALINKPGRVYWWLGLPVLVVFVASAFGYYSLLPRLLLFTLPGLWLLAAQGVKALWEWSCQWSRTSRSELVVLTLALALTLGGTNVLRHYWSPMRFSDARALTIATRSEGTTNIIKVSALPVVDYYARIHPATRFESHKIVAGSLPSLFPRPRPNGPKRDVLQVIYDVTTEPAVRQAIKKDSLFATGQGCSVTATDFFRAKILRVECAEAPDRERAIH